MLLLLYSVYTGNIRAFMCDCNIKIHVDESNVMEFGNQWKSFAVYAVKIERKGRLDCEKSNFKHNQMLKLKSQCVKCWFHWELLDFVLMICFASITLPQKLDRFDLFVSFSAKIAVYLSAWYFGNGAVFYAQVIQVSTLKVKIIKNPYWFHFKNIDFFSQQWKHELE